MYVRVSRYAHAYMYLCVLYRLFMYIRVLIVKLVSQKWQYLDKIYLLNFYRIAFSTKNMTTPL